jgi:spermidine synthase
MSDKLIKVDACDDGVEHHYELIQEIAHVQTARQKIEIDNFKRFGVGVWIDGWPQCAEFDSDRYHEALVHPSLIHRASSSTPFTACILGGGDFGVVNQLVKYKNLQSAHMVDWDLEFIELTKKHLTPIHHDSWKDPRVTVETKNPDVFQFFEVNKEQFDIVFGDLTDLTSMGSGVKSFIEQIKALVKSDGVFVSQSSEYPTMPSQYEEFISMVKMVGSIFKKVWIYKTYVPSFAYEQAFILGTDSLTFNPLASSASVIDENISALNKPLTEYSGAIHHGMFALPPSLTSRL